ncbi:hypothetical protein NLG97_g2903 [Lecanicillium saksenae]|uniref:Uncharacterized protein n=1 Tax=Lecanicillium saksenae TaxID=468837 RepID=A0ACC1QZM9_9HYPO|nr:hypothetical protein NLG97_g2903 [Lecanicillium saksenae]
MFSTISLFAALSALGAAATTPRSAAIIGGVDADIKDFPYQVSLQYNGKHICGASIIGSEYVLTAAHCFASRVVEDYNLLTIRAGSSITNSGGTVIKVSDVIHHNDMAIVKLETALQYGPGIGAIKLVDEGGLPAEGTPAVVAGWGIEELDGDFSGHLSSLDVPVLDRTQCNDNYDSRLTGAMFCAGFFEAGKDSCQGDDGGPIVDKNRKVQIRMISWGDGCAFPAYPAVYSSVSVLRKFIADNTGI